ncbi:MAG: hypothetical protein ACNYZG_11820 [Gammaproteobacteria bacterium]
MKKLNIAGALVLVFGLVLPSGAFAVTADDEVTIRVMEMHEKSTSSVMNRIQLPDLAGDKVTEQEKYRKRLTEHKGEGTKKVSVIKIGIVSVSRSKPMIRSRTRKENWIWFRIKSEILNLT